ncbi:MAG: hypothetical protein WCD00_07335 [Desulfuromonadaceae bacterium]
MKKNIAVLLAIAALALAGCQNTSKTEAPQNAAMKTRDIPAGSGNKSTVTKTMNAGGYTYVEATDGKGEKTWLALPEIKVAEGDKIEYPDTQPMVNYNSRTLKRKFDKILFVQGIRIVK